MDLNQVFANRSEEEDIYPLTVREIAEEKIKDKDMQQQKVISKFEETLIENTYVLCKKGKMIIPKTLQHLAVVRMVSPLSTAPRTYPSRRNVWKTLRKDV